MEKAGKETASINASWHPIFNHLSLAYRHLSSCIFFVFSACGGIRTGYLTGLTDFSTQAETVCIDFQLIGTNVADCQAWHHSCAQGKSCLRKVFSRKKRTGRLSNFSYRKYPRAQISWWMHRFLAKILGKGAELHYVTLRYQIDPLSLLSARPRLRHVRHADLRKF